MAQQSNFAQFMKANSTSRDARYAASHERASEPGTPVVPVAPASVQAAGVPENSPFYDHAKNILTPAPVDQDTKADAYDHFYAAKSPAELSTRLQGLDLPDDVHQQLLDAKQSVMPVATAQDRVVEAITRMANLPPATLELAEQHSNVLKALLAGSDL